MTTKVQISLEHLDILKHFVFGMVWQKQIEDKLTSFPFKSKHDAKFAASTLSATVELIQNEWPIDYLENKNKEVFVLKAIELYKLLNSTVIAEEELTPIDKTSRDCALSVIDQIGRKHGVGFLNFFDNTSTLHSETVTLVWLFSPDNESGRTIANGTLSTFLQEVSRIYSSNTSSLERNEETTLGDLLNLITCTSNENKT